jgi:hypothetical protein
MRGHLARANVPIGTICKSLVICKEQKLVLLPISDYHRALGGDGLGD